MEPHERLRRLNDALLASEVGVRDLRAFVDDHVNEESGEVKPMDSSDLATMVPAMLQRVTIALESLRVLVLDGLMR